jgi:hypothetical protein
MALGLTQSLTEIVPEIFVEVKDGRSVRLKLATIRELIA